MSNNDGNFKLFAITYTQFNGTARFFEFLHIIGGATEKEFIFYSPEAIFTTTHFLCSL
jgi:hypothetical protein